MKKRLIGMLLVLTMLLSVLPAAGLASDSTESTPTVYLSISDDGKYVTGNDFNETIMAYVPIALEDLEQIKLEDYGLENYYYDGNNDGEEDITVLHLYLYAMDVYYCGNAEPTGAPLDYEVFEATGSAGSLYMLKFWGHDCNLNYYRNGEYPLTPGTTDWGATADIMVPEDGDYIDIMMLTSWGFYSDSGAGFHYFLQDDDGELTSADIIHEVEATVGEAVEMTVARTYGDIDMGRAATVTTEPEAKVYYSQTMYGEDAQSVTPDADGNISITFPSAGTWHVWVDGMKGKDVDPENIVSSAGYTKVIVAEDPDQAAANEAAALIEALPAEDALTLDDETAVAAARAAFDALTVDQKALVSEEMVAALEAAEAKIAALKAAADQPETPAEPIEVPFTDVPDGKYYTKAVAYVYTNGLMNGVTDTSFSPDTTMNRAMVATVLYRLAGSPAVEGPCVFTDCKAGSFYYKAVIWASENGITSGTTATTFAPMDDVTREQMATFLYRYAKLAGYDTSISAGASLNGYPDVNDVSNFAKTTMLWAVDNGVIKGVGSNGESYLNPQDNATRGQIATVLMRFCEKNA